MPKQPSTLFTMQDYPTLSIRFFYTLIVQSVHRANRAGVQFELGVVEDVRQAGRTVVHNLPAVLTPQSPLSLFLAEAFNIRLSERQSFDLTKLVGRRLQARFDKGINGSLQAIAAVRPFPGDTDAADQTNGKTEQPE